MNQVHKISVSFNGSPMELKAGQTLSELLESAGKPDAPFAVAVNMQFVPGEKYASWCLQPGDCVDLVVAMQGG